jgi:hypothetical protein
MNTLSQPELQAFLENAAIEAASRESRIGRELRYHLPARRTVVIHFGGEESADYVSQVVSIGIAIVRFDSRRVHRDAP